MSETTIDQRMRLLSLLFTLEQELATHVDEDSDDTVMTDVHQHVEAAEGLLHNWLAEQGQDVNVNVKLRRGRLFELFLGQGAYERAETACQLLNELSIDDSWIEREAPDDESADRLRRFFDNAHENVSQLANDLHHYREAQRTG